MSIKVMSEVMEGNVADTAEFAVLMVLANFADEAGFCYPSMQTIARLARMSDRGARKVVRRLEEQGFLTSQIGGGRGGSTRYKITANPEPRSSIRPENPEQHSRNTDAKPGTAFPEYSSPRNPVPRKPGTRVHERGNPVPPNRQEPSFEPSKYGEPEPAQPFEAPDRTAEQDRFPEFWAAYPRREGQVAAEAAFITAAIRTDADLIIAGARAYAAARSGEDPRFTMLAAKWLTDRRWTDEHSAPPKPPDDPAAKRAASWRRIATSFDPTSARRSA